MAEQETLECPKCTKKGLVRHVHGEDDLFECVYCGYKVDLSKEQSTSSSGTFLVALITAIIFLLLLSG